MISDNNEYEAVIRMKQLLIKEKSDVQDGQVGTILNIGDYL